jgi:alpha-beta hydrolase superfamily lysophospholipase
MNFLDKFRGGTYSVVAFGNGANIALYYAHMMINDTTSTFKSIILVNPYSHIDKVIRKSLLSALESMKSNESGDFENDLVLLDHIIHSSESIPAFGYQM